MSLASEEMSVMNSTQHSMRRSRASLAKVRPVLEGRISVMIFWTVAVRSYVRVSGLVDYIWDLLWGVEAKANWRRISRRNYCRLARGASNV